MYVFYDIYYFYLTKCIIKTLEKENRNMIHKKYFITQTTDQFVCTFLHTVLIKKKTFNFFKRSRCEVIKQYFIFSLLDHKINAKKLIYITCPISSYFFFKYMKFLQNMISKNAELRETFSLPINVKAFSFCKSIAELSGFF